MAQDGFAIHTDEMRSHAQRVRGVAERIGTAKDAAGEISLNGGEAYGILCSPVLIPLMGMIETMGSAAIGTSQAAVEGTAAGLEAAAEEYDSVDEEVVASLEAILEELRGIGHG
ncbi:hypothetical protein GCM10027174_12960 [Salinifilum aidingensis]